MAYLLVVKLIFSAQPTSILQGSTSVVKEGKEEHAFFQLPHKGNPRQSQLKKILSLHLFDY
jgi:hypothetical protein